MYQAHRHIIPTPCMSMLRWSSPSTYHLQLKTHVYRVVWYVVWIRYVFFMLESDMYSICMGYRYLFYYQKLAARPIGLSFSCVSKRWSVSTALSRRFSILRFVSTSVSRRISILRSSTSLKSALLSLKSASQQLEYLGVGIQGCVTSW